MRFVPLRTPAALAFAAAAVLAFAAAFPACSSDPIVQTVRIGATCKASSDCGSTPWFICLTAGYSGGYCTKDCENDQDCPPEAICAFGGTGATTGQCKLRCMGSDCGRPTLTCKPKDIVNSDTFASAPYCDTSGGGSDAGVQPGPDLASAPKDGAASHD